MSIKRLPPEAIETFSLVLHPKRKYSMRVPQEENDILTEAGDDLDAEDGSSLILEG